MSTLTVASTSNFIGQTFSPTVTLIDFTNSLLVTATATFAASQFNNTDILVQASIDGSQGKNRMIVDMQAVAKFDLSGLTFTNWSNLSDSFSILGGAAGNAITGTRVKDTITGGGGNDVIRGFLGLDVLRGDAGDDTFVISATDGSVTGESIDGGIGTDKLRVISSGTVDFTGASLVSIEALTFTNASGVAVARLGNGQVGSAVSGKINQIAGNGQANTVEFTGGPFDYGILSFSSWSAADSVVINQTGNGTYGGTSVADRIIDSAAATFNGQGGDDVYHYTSGVSDGTAGDQINGGQGFDTILAQLTAPGLLDLTLLSGLSEIERILFGAGGLTVSVTTSQLLLGGITTVEGSTGVDTLSVICPAAGGKVDLTTVSFLNWNELEDSIHMTGDAGVDILTGAAVKEDIAAGAGNDVIAGSAGADHLDGGADFDTIGYLNSTEGVVVDLSLGTGIGGEADGDVLASFERVVGSEHDDTLIGDDNDNELFGKKGNDTIRGSDGEDTLSGGEDVDTLSYEDDTTGVTVKLETNTVGRGDADGDVISEFENIEGGSGADVLSGDSGVNIVRGNAGVDSLAGLGGDDTLIGGADNDSVSGGIGADQLAGGSGIDTLVYEDSSESVTIDLAAQTASGGEAAGDVFSGFENISASEFDDTLTGDGKDNEFEGGGGNDTMSGGIGADLLDGQAGQDSIFGGNGDDQLVGGDDNDTLNGEAGGDMFLGAGGKDILTGGLGADRFFYVNAADSGPGAAERDTITDFVSGVDVIDLSQIRQDPFIGTHIPFHFLPDEGAAFSLEQPEVTFSHGTSNTFIAINFDSDAEVEMRIVLNGIFNLVATDFAL